jgi:hypothetical protein
MKTYTSFLKFEAPIKTYVYQSKFRVGLTKSILHELTLRITLNWCCPMIIRYFPAIK